MPELALLDSRYRILRKIGAGGMGVVYLVIDSYKENKIMALKTCAKVDAGSAEEFKAEFRNILGVRHPHIPEVFDFGTLRDAASTLYFTSEFIDGQPLDSLQESWSPEQLREVLVGLCRALAFLHSRGLLHRDIKPGNVLAKLNSEGGLELLKLVDFGLSAGVQTEQEGVGGTVDYLAPEVMQGDAPGIASDLYSLGLLIYRLACGTLPFADEDPLTAARKRTRMEAPSPLRYRADLPVGLADVIQAMIQLKPEERPAGARHVIALLNEREGTDYPYETAETSRAYVQSAATVTNPEARRILDLKRHALLNDEQPRSVFIASLSGMGRGRLFKDLASELTLAGISSRVIRAASELAALDDCPRALLIPNIESVGAERVAGAMRALAGRKPWWVLGGENYPAELLSLHAELRRVTLQPLGERDVREFIAAIFPENDFPEQFRKRLYSETVGVPSALQAVIDELQQRELLRIGLRGWEILPGEWELPVHADVRKLILTQLAGLAPVQREQLELLTGSTDPIPGEVLTAACETDLPLSRPVEEIGSAWVESVQAEHRIRFAAVRRVVADELSADQKRALHRRLFTAWRQAAEIDSARRDREMLYNDFKSGNWDASPDTTQRILNEAIQNGYLNWTYELLSWSIRNAPPPLLREPLWIALSRCEYIQGRFGRAAELLGDLIDNGDAPITPENIQLHARYANLLEKLGQTEPAEKILQRALEKLSPEHNAAAGAIFGTLAWITFKQGDQDTARKFAEEGLTRIPPHTIDPGIALLLNTFATLAFYQGDTEVASLYFQRCLEVSEKLGDRKAIANMYNNLGVVAAQSGDRIRARNLWEQCAEIAREINDTHRLAGIYNNLGVDALETGSLHEAEEYYLKSLMLFRRMQSPREQVEILSNLGELSFYRADFPRAQAYFREAIALADELQDRECQVEPLVYMGRLLISLERLEEAESILTRARATAHEAGTRKGEAQALENLALIYRRTERVNQINPTLKLAHELLPDDLDPLASIHLNLSECLLAYEIGEREHALSALEKARQIADIKWDPYAAARTQIYGLLFAKEELDDKTRVVAARKLSVFPGLSWAFHWAEARRHVEKGALKSALTEFGRAVSILKTITARLSPEDREKFLNAPTKRQFRVEALQARELSKRK